MRFIVLLMLAAAPAFAQDLAEGKAAFDAHCVVCHGPRAEGDGLMAALLTIQPADLTQLSVRNDGAFPMARVIQRIDGTTEVLAHGGAMPVFGTLLQGPSASIVGPDGSDVVAPETILNIAAWLETVQR